MYSLNQVNKLVSCGRDPARSLPLWRGFLLIPLILVCFALSPQAQAICLDGCNAGSSTRFKVMMLSAAPPALEIQRLVGGRSLLVLPAASIRVLAPERWSSTMAFQHGSWRCVRCCSTPRHTENTAVGTDALVFNDSGVFQRCFRRLCAV